MIRILVTSLRLYYININRSKESSYIFIAFSINWNLILRFWSELINFNGCTQSVNRCTIPVVESWCSRNGYTYVVLMTSVCTLLAIIPDQATWNETRFPIMMINILYHEMKNGLFSLFLSSFWYTTVCVYELLTNHTCLLRYVLSEHGVTWCAKQ